MQKLDVIARRIELALRSKDWTLEDEIDAQAELDQAKVAELYQLNKNKKGFIESEREAKIAVIRTILREELPILKGGD